MEQQRDYKLSLTWTGNKGSGTSDYNAYERDHTISADGKPAIAGSSDPIFRGDASKYNPEELLLAAVSACHMLWYLHLCSDAKIVVNAYGDQPVGIVNYRANGEGAFAEIILNPCVTLADGAMETAAHALHKKANSLCLIANSLNFPVKHRPVFCVE